MGGRPDRIAEANQAAIALFSAIIAAAIAVIGYLLRFGFSDNAPLQWAKYVGLSWFLLHFSLVGRWLLRIDGAKRSGRWWTSHATLTLAALGLMVLAGMGWSAAGTTDSSPAAWIMAIVSVVGTAGFALALMIQLTTVRLRYSAVLVVFAGLFSLYAAGASWGSGDRSPLFVEELCRGQAAIDTLYHASISNMLRTYGIPSTGLDGLPYVPYHYGSHWIFARLCNLLDVRVIDFYNRGFPIVFIPFGVLSLGTVAVSLAQRWRVIEPRLTADATAAISTKNETRDPFNPTPTSAEPGLQPIGAFFWFVLSLGYIGFLPYASNFMPSTGWNSIVLSESYAVAVAVSLLAIASICRFAADAFVSGRRLGLMAASLGAILILLVVAAIGLLKLSVMLLLVAVTGYVFLRLKLFRSVSVWVWSAALVLVAGTVFRAASDPGYFALGESRFFLFGFPRANVEPQWWPDYLLIYYAWVWTLLAVRFWEERICTLGDLTIAWRERRLLDVELVLVAALVGAGPGLIMKYSSTHYFSNYQQWLALALLLSITIRRPWMSSMITQGGNRSEDLFAAPARRSHESGIGRIKVTRLFSALVVLSLGGTLFSNTLVLLDGMVATNLAARGHASRQTGLGVALMHGRLQEASEILRQTAAGVESRLTSGKKIVAVLGSLDEMPLAEKRRSLLFIPKSNRQYWDLLHGPYWPKDGPFVGPALSGLAMIDGLYVPTKDDPWIGHGYDRYSKAAASRAQPPLSEYLPTLRERCAQMGFKQLIVIDSDQKPSKFDCP
jgi:hypothetical protein